MATADRHSYVELYPSDWLAGMAFMPPMAEWVYLQVCLFNWDKAEALPAPEARLRLSRHAGWEADLAMLVDAGKITRTQGGGLFVSRALAQARKARDLWERKSQGGKTRRNQGFAKQSANTPDSTAPQNENENENDREDKSSHVRAPEGADAHVPARDAREEGVNGDLVFSVPPDVWRDFRAHRDKLKAPMTQRAEALMLRKLERMWESGHDPTAVIEQSMLRGWRDVFELKEGRNGDDRNRSSTGSQSGDGFTDAIREHRNRQSP